MTEVMSPLTDAVSVTIVAVILVILVVGYDWTKGRQTSPFLEEDLLKLLTSRANGSTNWVEEHTVLDHELEVIIESLSCWVVAIVKLPAHRRKIHGLLDDFRVAGQLHLHPIFAWLSDHSTHTERENYSPTGS